MLPIFCSRISGLSRQVKGCGQVHGTSCRNIGTKFGDTKVGGENRIRAQWLSVLILKFLTLCMPKYTKCTQTHLHIFVHTHTHLKNKLSLISVDIQVYNTVIRHLYHLSQKMIGKVITSKNLVPI